MTEMPSKEKRLPGRFDRELDEVRNEVLAMGGMVEEQIARAMDALLARDSALGERVIGRDAEVNSLEVAIDERCSHILASRHNTPDDLRLVMAIIKTITDLERIGDEAEKIGFLATRLAAIDSPGVRDTEIRHMAGLARHLTHEALNAFARMDPEAARKVARKDHEIDDDYEALLRQLITLMMEDPRTIREVLDLMWAARALERIGDHAKNICEYVIYLVHGKDVRDTGDYMTNRLEVLGERSTAGG